MSKTEGAFEAAYQSLAQLNCTASLSNEARRLLTECAVIQPLKTGNFAWRHGDSGEFCSLVLSGMIEIIRPSGTESFNTMGVFARGDVIGLSALIKRSTFPGSARVVAPDTQIMKFYLRALLQDKSVGHSAEIGDWVREMILRHEQILRDKIDIVGAGRIESRLFELLRHLNRRFGVPQSRFAFVIPLQISKTLAAKLIDIRVETAIRLINAWRKKGFLIWEDHQITIPNLEALDRFVLLGK